MEPYKNSLRDAQFDQTIADKDACWIWELGGHRLSPGSRPTKIKDSVLGRLFGDGEFVLSRSCGNAPCVNLTHISGVPHDDVSPRRAANAAVSLATCSKSVSKRLFAIAAIEGRRDERSVFTRAAVLHQILETLTSRWDEMAWLADQWLSEVRLNEGLSESDWEYLRDSAGIPQFVEFRS